MKTHKSKNKSFNSSKAATETDAKENNGTKIPVNPDDNQDLNLPEENISDIEYNTPLKQNKPLNPPIPSDPNVSSFPNEINPIENNFNKRNYDVNLTMKNKSKFINPAITILIISLFLSFPSIAGNNKPAPETLTIENPEISLLMKRLEEIKTIDKSELKREDKRMLREEVREIKKKMAEASGGIYLSAGALIVIIILLIILV